jgi:hypothetical protein
MALLLVTVYHLQPCVILLHLSPIRLAPRPSCFIIIILVIFLFNFLLNTSQILIQYYFCFLLSLQCYRVSLAKNFLNTILVFNVNNNQWTLNFFYRNLIPHSMLCQSKQLLHLSLPQQSRLSYFTNLMAIIKQKFMRLFLFLRIN